MRVLLVQPALGIDVPVYLGLAHISASLRKAGYDTSLTKISKPINQKVITKIITDYSPNLVGFTCVTHHWPYVEQWAGFIKKVFPELPLIIGGPHATINPDSIMECNNIDAIIIGEGENAVVQLAAAYAKNNEPTGIPGTIVRSQKNRKWLHEGPGTFCEDLDSLPYADHTIYGKKQRGDLYINAGRGCPFDCAYCCNHLFKKAQNGRYVRMRSAKHIIAELKEHIKKRKVNRIIFADDTFTLNKSWIKNFLPIYRNEIGIPFLANAHVKHFNKEIAFLLKDAGCEHLQFGIESGSEIIRKEILRRPMTNADIMKAVKTAKDAELNVFALYMIGFPNETVEMAQETLELHKQLGIEVAMITVFYPYPGTHLWNTCEKLNILSDKEKLGYQDAISTLKKINMTPDELSSIYNEFESMRLQGQFSDLYIFSNYPWAQKPIKFLSFLFEKKHIIYWAKKIHSFLTPSIVFNKSTY